jgi:hypothetical protein
VLGNWQKEAAYTRELSLVHNPAHVYYRTAKFMWSAAAGVRQDHAYWVSQVMPATNDQYATVDLQTHGCGGSDPVVIQELPGAGLSPVPWISHSAAITGQDPITQAAVLSGTVTGVSSLTVDTTATCLAGPIQLQVKSDQPATINFSDGRTATLPGGDQTSTLSLPAPSASAMLADPTGAISGGGQTGYASA